MSREGKEVRYTVRWTQITPALGVSYDIPCERRNLSWSHAMELMHDFAERRRLYYTGQMESHCPFKNERMEEE